MSSIVCLETLDAMMTYRDQLLPGQNVALVPTMGYLHQGHLALVEEAKRLAPEVIVSIFVNPLQFGPHEDFEKYPRDLARDLRLLESYRPLSVFAPSVSEMYPQGPSRTVITLPSMTNVMCGLGRPGHFDGVATVVCKLFNIVRPSVALFGKKDAQQLAIIRQLTRDLNFPVEIVGVPTVREPSGLALSSRNQYLTPVEKDRAAFLYQALLAGQKRFEGGERNAEKLVEEVADVLREHSIEPEYVSLVDANTLVPLEEELGTSRAILALAARIGKARLIDNVVLEP